VNHTQLMHLTENQRRHLTIYLAQVEDAVESVERLATTPAGERALRIDRRDLPDDFARASRDELAAVRGGLAEVARALGLEPLERSRAQEALGLLTIAIVQLEDAGSRGLRGYGEVDPAAPAVLDPALARLRAMLARVAARLGAPRRSTEPMP
jgi:hypothetical protein